MGKSTRKTAVESTAGSTGVDTNPAIVVATAGQLQQQDPITPSPVGKRRRRTQTAATAAEPTNLNVVLLNEATLEEDQQQEEEEVLVATTSRRKRSRRTHTTMTILNDQDATEPTEQAADKEEEDVERTTTTITKVKRGRKRDPDPLPCIDPTPELLASLQSSNYTPPPRPVPNLGYACLNMDLRELKPPVFTSRDCIKRTLEVKGVACLGELTLANVKDLARVIQWNHEHGIQLFRISSVLQPWMGVHNIRSFPQFEEIKAALQFAGDLSKVYKQRLTFHPSHFVKLAAEDDALVARSIAELEAHSFLFDLMGFQPSHENKINIHVGGVYGDKQATMERWAMNYNTKCSENLKLRLTCENDDVASAFSLEDLLTLHELCEKRLPLVFDFHHHRFCPGSLTEEQALRAAIATWPAGVRPVVHWSESQKGRKPHAHSDYIRGPLRLHGLETDVDVMFESKCKERALIAYRDGLEIPCDSGGDEEEEGGAVALEVAAMAERLLG